MKELRRRFLRIGVFLFIFLFVPANAALAGSFLDVAKETGIEIVQDGDAVLWQGKSGGQTKSQGPLAGKKVAAIVASEFSDFQAYYLASYIGEYGGTLDFLCVDWVTWKFTRPNVKDKGVQGMWGLSLDPIPVMGPAKHNCKNLGQAKAADYDAVVILGGHSGDVMVTEAKVMDFIKAANQKGAVIGGIEAGIMPLIATRLVEGKKTTGNCVVSYMLKKISSFRDTPMVRDGNLITARDTVDTPAFVQELCKAFDPAFVDKRRGILAGKRIVMIAGEDFEDIELVVPAMEFIHRGAQITLATFPAPMKSRPALLGLDVVQGNFGCTVPFQEIPASYYRITKLSEISMNDFDLVMIPGAFCPWNLVVSGRTEWLKQADRAGKFIAAICHAPIPLAAADLVSGKKIAGWLASKDSVEIMGGKYSSDYAAVVDGRIVTGRTPPEVPEFLDAITYALLQ